MHKYQKIMCSVLSCSIVFFLLSTSLAQQTDTAVRRDLKVSVLSDSLDLRQGAIACNREDEYRVVTQSLSLQDMDDDSDSIAFVVEKDYYDSVCIADRTKIRKKIIEEFNNKKRVCFMGDDSNLDPNQISSIFNGGSYYTVSSQTAADEDLIAIVYRLDEIGRPVLTTYSCSKDRMMSNEQKVSFVLNNSFECPSKEPVEKITAMVDVYGSGYQYPAYQKVLGSTRMIAFANFEYRRAVRGNKGTKWDVKITSSVEPLGEYRTVFVKNRMSQYNFITSNDEVLLDYWPETGRSRWSGVNVVATSNGLNPGENVEIVYNFTDSSAGTSQKLVSEGRWWNQSRYFQTRFHCTFYVGDEVRELGQNITVLDIRTGET